MDALHMEEQSLRTLGGFLFSFQLMQQMAAFMNCDDYMRNRAWNNYYFLYKYFLLKL